MPRTEKLYEITSETENKEELSKVQSAIDWLLSDKSEGIGKKLLEDAYALHQKPIKIIVTNNKENSYHDENGIHTIFINPNYAENVAGKENKKPTIKQLLAHEIVHATQKGIEEEATKQLQAKLSSEREYLANVGADGQAKRAALFALAATSETRETALQNIRRYVGEFGLKDSLEIQKIFDKNPQNLEHIKNYENPSVQIENKIAQLSGGVVRESYSHSIGVTNQETLKETLVNDIADTLEISKKPTEKNTVDLSSSNKNLTNKQVTKAR